MSKNTRVKFKEGDLAIYTDDYGFWARQGDPILPGTTVRILSLMQPFGCSDKDYATIQDPKTGASMLARTVDLKEDTSLE